MGNDGTTFYFHTDLDAPRGRVIAIDLKNPDGKALAQKLAASADVVVESFRPGVLEQLGFGYGTLRELNPRIVLTSISNFGQTGPYRDWAGSELVLFGMGGEMYSMGLADREPLKMGGTAARCV